MVFQVRYTGLAAQEIKEAFVWYREQAGDQVAERFMDEVDRAGLRFKFLNSRHPIEGLLGSIEG
jgi:plasmid stabilization system protein ParE